MTTCRRTLVHEMAYASNNGIRLHYELISWDGRSDLPLLVLINGLGSQCISYRDELCAMYVGAGARVLRMDNRDVGLSDSCETAYTLSDMADDVIAVLDSIGESRAHVIGMSLGGMIVQTLAIRHPSRLLTATSIMSTTGNPAVGQPSEEAKRLLLTPGSTTREGAIAAHLRGLEVWGSPGRVDVEGERVFAGAAFDRACRPEGVARQYKAARGDGSRDERLKGVSTPFFVIHGSADTLIDVSGGRHTAAMVPWAHLTVVDGMGHDLPRQFWPALVDHFRRQVLLSRPHE